MDFSWSDEQLACKEAARQFASTTLDQDVDRRGAQSGFCRERWRQCAQFGVLGMPFPKAYGGAGCDLLTTVLTMEGLGYGCRDNGLLFALNAQMWSVQHLLSLAGTPAQKMRYLPALIRGELLGAHAMTEREAGSDAYSMSTRAEKCSAGYCLNGSKTLITHAPVADMAIVFATTDPRKGYAVIIPEYLTKFPVGLAQLMADERISVWYSVPYALIQLLEHGNLRTWDLSALRWVLFAGEPFPAKHLCRLMTYLPQARFCNLYGPTETNVCTYYHVPPMQVDEAASLPIGRACAGIRALVVDPQGRSVPPGVSGELWISGPTTMRGYWGRPDLDLQSFASRPDSGSDIRFYRTGDLVQSLSDGNFLYLGRKDRQVKIRGYRVELDEIEAALLSHEAVREAAVYTIPDGYGSCKLAGAVIPKTDRSLTERQLRQHAAHRLPTHARPAVISILPDFPRTSTGKVNRRLLQTVASTGNVCMQEESSLCTGRYRA